MRRLGLLAENAAVSAYVVEAAARDITLRGFHTRFKIHLNTTIDLIALL